MTNLNNSNKNEGTLYNMLTHTPIDLEEEKSIVYGPRIIKCNSTGCDEYEMFDEAPRSTIWYCDCCKWCMDQLEGASSMEED